METRNQSTVKYIANTVISPEFMISLTVDPGNGQILSKSVPVLSHYSLLETLKTAYPVKTETVPTSNTTFIISINNIDKGMKVWNCYLNGSRLTTSPDRVIVKPADMLEWKLESPR